MCKYLPTSPLPLKSWQKGAAPGRILGHHGFRDPRPPLRCALRARYRRLGHLERPLPRFLEEEKVDVALLDATFYSPDELPDRDVTKIKHPLVTDSMELLGSQVKAGKLRVFFTHLNHSNPALDPERFAVLEDGAEIGL